MTKTLALLATMGIAWLVSAWFLMITVGVVHAEWIPQLPTIGFSIALLLASFTVLRAVFAAVLKVVSEAITGGDR